MHRAGWNIGPINYLRLLLPAIVTLSACSILEKDVGQTLLVTDGMLDGATDYHMALDLFGPPHRISASETGMVWLYEEIDLHETQLGINLAGKRATLFKAALGLGHEDRRLLILFFDPSGETRASHYEQRAGAAARGAALQFIFAVAGVVDAEDLNAPPATHDWGFGLLETDLPVALNRLQSLDFGEHGLQQQATPTSVGQRALELQP
jgi:hypothetical protein